MFGILSATPNLTRFQLELSEAWADTAKAMAADIFTHFFHGLFMDIGYHLP